MSEAMQICRLLGIIQYRVKFIVENIDGIIVVEKVQYKERWGKNQKQCDQPFVKAEKFDKP